MEKLFGQRNQNGDSYRHVNSDDIIHHRLSSNSGCSKFINNYVDSLLEDGCLSYRHVNKKDVSVSFILNEVLKKNPVFKKTTMKSNIFSEEEIRVDIEQIKFVLNQVLENALLYSDGKEQAKIDLHKGTDSLTLSIKDKGIGIDSFESNKVFLPFFRGLDASKFSKGIGLGLTLSKAILMNNDAEIKVESQGRGLGTSVYISFPYNDKHLQYREAFHCEVLVPRAASC